MDDCAFDEVAFDGQAFDICVPIPSPGADTSAGGGSHLDERMWNTSRAVKEEEDELDELTILLAAYREYYH